VRSLDRKKKLVTATDAAPSDNNGASRASYEELRRLALDGSVSDRHAALLMREGVVAWMSHGQSTLVRWPTPRVQERRSSSKTSTKRQYALRQQAVMLGWPLESVVVIDTDLGQSGASTDRDGFQKLVAEVGLGHAGIVLGLEVSRLARNSTDWHRLL